MKRRNFLRNSFYSLILSRIGLSNIKTIDRNKIKFFKESGQSYSIDGFFESGIQYISLTQLSTHFADRDFFNADNKKLVIVKNEQRIIVTADNTFIKIDDAIYQLYYPVQYKENEIWMNVEEFAEIMSEYSTIKLYYGSTDRSLSYESAGYNITGVDFDERMNGILIRLKTTKRFSKSSISYTKKENRVYLTIYEAFLNEKSFKSLQNKGIIRKVDAIQTQKTAQIIFTVLGKLNKSSVSVEVDQANNDILLVIGTALSANDMSQLEDEKQKDTEVKKKVDSRFVVDTIVLDPGHGGKDPGAVGQLSGKKKLLEKHVVLNIGHQLKKILEKRLPDTKIVLTRTQDEYYSLYQRGKAANRVKGKLFISIHCNANKSSKANGFSTYVIGTSKTDEAREAALLENKVIEYDDAETQRKYKGINLIKATMAQSAYARQSFHLAAIMNNQVGTEMSALSVKNRGVKQAPFYVLYGPSMPSVLVETAFISNKNEVKILASRNNQNKIAESISGSIVQYTKDIDAIYSG
jgi:N-acetylmuramoyl-L-alanine amidase